MINVEEHKKLLAQVAELEKNSVNYFAIASAAIVKMFELVGSPKFDGDKMIRGVIVRHLVLPNFRHDSIKIVDWLYKTFGDEIFISLMNQYTPVFRAGDFKKISRALTTFDINPSSNARPSLALKIVLFKSERLPTKILFRTSI